MGNKDNQTIDWIDEQKDDLTQIKLKSLFDYCPSGNLIKRSSKKIVGSLDKSTGYIRYKFKGINHRIHRLIWIWHNGAVPEGFIIDHKFNDKLDNKIESLRLLSDQHNKQNIHKANNNNLIGLRGVSKKGNSYIARISCNGKAILLGVFPSPELAHKEYIRQKELIHKGYRKRGI